MITERKFVTPSSTCCGMLGLLLVSSTAWAMDLPNDTIPASGSPAFYNNVVIDMNDNAGRLKVTGRGDFVFDNGSSFFNGQKVIYKLKAFYDNSGNLSSGEVTIHGAIPGIAEWSAGEILMTADINEWNLHDDPNLWAFGTENIVCSPLLVITCTQSESVYVSLLGGFDGDFDNGRFHDFGFAVTTVPVPAAAWLFGSALVLLGWVRRRKLM
jgi:hypothetical protein